MFDYDDFVTRIDDALVLARYWSLDAERYVTAAFYEYGLGNDHDALREIMSAVKVLQWSVDKLAPYKNLLYGLWNLERLGEGIRDDFTNLCDGGEYELTLNKILGAYISAEELERRNHLLLTDAFRATMFDKPFDKEYHAFWVRTFKSWE